MTRDAPRPPSRLSSPTFSPLYRQIKDFLIRSLEEGEWGPGDAIPSEGELATRFNVSQGTVRKAIDEMAAENMLVRRQGKGTFVATHSDPRSFYRFLRLVRRWAYLPATRWFTSSVCCASVASRWFLIRFI
jgi:GntR family transcriptional regulator